MMWVTGDGEYERCARCILQNKLKTEVTEIKINES